MTIPGLPRRIRLYRYHSDDCKVHKMKLTLKQKREFLDCDCWLWITGYTDADQPIQRGTLKTRDLGEAVKQARQINAASVTENSKPDDPQGRTIPNAVDTFLRAHKSKVSPRVLVPGPVCR